MKSSFAISWLRAAKRHIDEKECYRWWALYSACLVTFMYSTWFWPWSADTHAMAYRVSPWLYDMARVVWKAGVMLVWILAVVGLVRSNWIGRGLAAYGVWMGHYMLTYYPWDPRGWLWTEFMWYAFDLPGKWIHGLAGEGTALATFLWFVYMFLAWIAVRPLVKRVYPIIPWLSGRLMERWPKLRRFATPVM